jgi:flagellin
MARINSNIPSLIAQQHLKSSNANLGVRLERLSTGLRINRGKDDPAGLVISERIRSDIEGVNQGIRNAERASSVIATTEAALTEINDLLNSVRSLIVEAANTGANSAVEREANQLQIDSAIESITRISNTATFGGLKLLNGNQDYVLSGVDGANIDKARVWNATFNGVSSVDVEVEVLQSAQVGALFLNGDHGAAAANGTLLSSMELEIRGPYGVQVVNFLSGTDYGVVVTAINQLKEFTGVEAELINGNANSGITFKSADYGSANDRMISVTRLNIPQDGSDTFSLFKFNDGEPLPDFSGGFDWATWPGTIMTAGTSDKGQDVAAIVNGILASGDGLKISTNTAALGVELILDETFATDPTTTPTSFTITGGGALFQLGPEITAQQQAAIAIPSVAASALGGTLNNGVVEFLNSLKKGGGNSIQDSYQNNDWSTAQRILGSAIDEVSRLRGRLGAFERNVLEPNVRSLASSLENLTASNSIIRDADFAMETSELTRAQILSSSGTSVLGLANQQSQQVLQLLG